ncbi:cupin domain-containing protein [Phenylobacterium sp.]|jgi:mannose-6-phosphate isomerase-like protein (cupin superfamily)|uniref:cupin domain-containing protein n=1 Tax=Phenylobacterium sp. TaxID=1871053 RepID=UPI002E3490B9|nr:cupin domain-containing protein [Phenylobacterium sp.]HEX2561113.1 cupin domain-containing protein [Phenylobacterium sp.]
MPPLKVDLQDRFLVYDEGRGAFTVSKLLDGLSDADDVFLIGVSDFSDDASVHADHWEIHPAGDEILCVLQGRLLATVDQDGAVEAAEIGPGEALIVPKRSWHRLQVLKPGRLLFFTPTAGVAHRPHEPAASRPTSSAEA